MAFFDYLIPGLAAVSGAVSNRGSKQTTASAAPVYSPQDQDLRNATVKATQDSLTTDPNLEGYKAGQVSLLNKNADIQRQNVRENAALHGVTGDALDAALNNVDSQRFSGITQLNQSVPLTAMQLRQQTIQNANNVFSAARPATQSTTTVPGNKFGGALGNLAETIAYLHGRGAFGTLGKKQKPIGAGGADIPSVPGLA